MPGTTTLETIPLSKKQRKEALKTLGELYSSFQQLSGAVEGSEVLDQDLTKNVLVSAEISIAALAELAHIKLVTAKDIEDRFALLRQANMRVQQLEQMLCDQVSCSAVADKLTAYSAQLRAWWRAVGLGQVANICFTEDGFANITLSCTLKGVAPPTGCAESWVDALREKSFIVGKTIASKDAFLTDCEQNRALLVAMIQEKLPSAVLLGTTNCCNPEGELQIKSIDVSVRYLGDLAGG